MRRYGAVAGVVVAAACAPASPTPSATSSPAPRDQRPALSPIPEATPEAPLSNTRLHTIGSPATGDLDAIIARGYLRILVTPSRTHYSAEGGRQRGAAYDVGKAFEAFLKSRVSGAGTLTLVFIPVRHDRLIQDLNAGRGDIAANLGITFERQDVVAFAEPARSGIREVVVTGPGVLPLVSLEDVAGRAIHVRKSSEHYASLVRLNGQLQKINKPISRIVPADEKLTDEDLLEMVNSGTLPATLVDDYLFDAWRPVFDKLSVNKDVAVSQDGTEAWAMRKDAPKLLALVNEFTRTHNQADRVKAAAQSLIPDP